MRFYDVFMRFCRIRLLTLCVFLGLGGFKLLDEYGTDTVVEGAVFLFRFAQTIINVAYGGGWCGRWAQAGRLCDLTASDYDTLTLLLLFQAG